MIARPAIYFRMPRVASATLARLSEGRCVILPHDLAPREVQAVLNANRTKYRWTFVRHPYSRFVSAWDWVHRGVHPRMFPFDMRQRFALRKYETMECLAHNLDALCADPKTHPIHFYPQSSYIYLRGRCLVDFVGKYEALEEDYAQVKSVLGLRRMVRFGPNEKNMDRCAPTTPDLPADVRLALDEFYSEDFERFGYELSRTPVASGGRM